MTTLQITLIVCGALVVAVLVAPVIAYFVKVRRIKKKHEKIVDDFFRDYKF